MQNAWPKLAGVAWQANHAPDIVQLRTWSTDTDLHWELRSLTQYVLVAAVRRLGVWLRRDAGGWSSLCETLLGHPGYLESKRASQAGSASGSQGLGADAHGEWAAPTDSFVLLMVWLGEHRRNGEEREKSKAVLLQWILRFMSAESRELLLSTVPEQVHSSSCERSGSDGRCPCWAAVIERVESRGASHECIQQLLLVCISRTECPRCSSLLHHLTSQIQRAVVSSYDADDHLTDGTKAEDIHIGKHKRRRIDEGVKTSTMQAVIAGRAPNSTSLLRAMGDDRSGQAHHWDAMLLRETLARYTYTWKGGGCFGLAPDGARLGNPGQENLICSVWHAESATGGWAPPQV